MYGYAIVSLLAVMPYFLLTIRVDNATRKVKDMELTQDSECKGITLGGGKAGMFTSGGTNLAVAGDVVFVKVLWVSRERAFTKGRQTLYVKYNIADANGDATKGAMTKSVTAVSPVFGDSCVFPYSEHFRLFLNVYSERFGPDHRWAYLGTRGKKAGGNGEVIPSRSECPGGCAVDYDLLSEKTQKKIGEVAVVFNYVDLTPKKETITDYDNKGDYDEMDEEEGDDEDEPSSLLDVGDMSSTRSTRTDDKNGFCYPFTLAASMPGWLLNVRINEANNIKDGKSFMLTLDKPDPYVKFKVIEGGIEQKSQTFKAKDLNDVTFNYDCMFPVNDLGKASLLMEFMEDEKGVDTTVGYVGFPHDKGALGDVNKDKCTKWVNSNQCKLNPGFMLRECHQSCLESAQPSGFMFGPGDKVGHIDLKRLYKRCKTRDEQENVVVSECSFQFFVIKKNQKIVGLDGNNGTHVVSTSVTVDFKFVPPLASRFDVVMPQKVGL
eukprot:TRINITY_DN15000_c0_g1_i1.p1 TRINITY_DN15000_c0_g1~~TRINITY_DN15000_c0_g1_i1.p1  ORF type:complete len:492 (+),score=59.15 TRINITY_DN15000_c0_g1_i1:70-1545(+)